MAVLDLLTERAPRTHLNRIEASIHDSDPYGIDVQLTLYVCYELHYRGFAGVDDGWEWNPGLLHLRAQLEDAFLSGVQRDVGEIAMDATAAAEIMSQRFIEIPLGRGSKAKADWAKHAPPSIDEAVCP